MHTSSVAAIGPARAARDRRREPAVSEPATSGSPTSNSKHEAEVEALRLAAHGLPVVIVNPSFVLGPDDPKGTSMELVRRFLLGRIPAYVDGGLNIVDVRDVAQGHLLADEKGEVGERYILARPQLHARPAVRRFRPDLGSRAPGQAAGTRRRPSPCEAIERVGLPLPVSPDEVRSATLWWTYRNTKARRELGLRAATPRGDARGRRAVADGRARRPRRTRRGPQEAALAAVAPLLRLGGRVFGE